jgi:hypothetical protein
MDLMWPLMLAELESPAPPILSVFRGVLGVVKLPDVSVTGEPPSISAAKSSSANAKATLPDAGLVCAPVFMLQKRTLLEKTAPKTFPAALLT